MPPISIGTGLEQSPITVNRMYDDPLVVPEVLRHMFRAQFIADQILRNAGRATGGAVQYWVPGPIAPDLAGGGAEVLAPLSEIPVVNPVIGDPASVSVVPRGLGLRISRTLRDRENVGAVMRGIEQIRNQIVKSVDGALMAALRAAVTQTVAVATPWNAATGTTIRRDWVTARRLVEDLRDSGFDYSPDTLLLNRGTRDALLLSSEFQAPFIGAVAGQNPLIDGQLPAQAWGYRFLVSPEVATGEAWLLQRNTVGGIADERGTPGNPIEVSDMFHEPAYDDAVRWNVTRAAAGFIDAPGSAVRFTGVGA